MKNRILTAAKQIGDSEKGLEILLQREKAKIKAIEGKKCGWQTWCPAPTSKVKHDLFLKFETHDRKFYSSTKYSYR